MHLWEAVGVDLSQRAREIEHRKIGPEDDLVLPELRDVQLTNDGGQYFGEWASVPMKTFSCFHAIAIISSCHGMPT